MVNEKDGNHLLRQIYASHSNGERLLWIGLWSFAVFYTIYCVSPASESKIILKRPFALVVGV
jgi:hypothetical protein